MNPLIMRCESFPLPVVTVKGNLREQQTVAIAQPEWVEPIGPTRVAGADRPVLHYASIYSWRNLWSRQRDIYCTNSQLTNCQILFLLLIVFPFPLEFLKRYFVTNVVNVDIFKSICQVKLSKMTSNPYFKGVEKSTTRKFGWCIWYLISK